MASAPSCHEYLCSVFVGHPACILREWSFTRHLHGADFVESGIAALVVLAAVLLPGAGQRFLAILRRGLLPLARKPRLTILLAGLSPVLLRLVLLLWFPAPPPRTMEEHNHLLQADTYANWRLANPPHPLAVLLSSFQVVSWPKYVTSRPPLSGLFLFLGEILFHSPFLGNLLSVGLLSATLSWMLFGWLPRFWATVGSLVIVLQFCLFGHWVNSYWCDTVPILGGALLLALVPRIEQRSRISDAALFVIGLALLAGTRPFEGFFYAAAVSLYLFVALLKADQRRQFGARVRKLALPIAVGCVLIICGQLHYNKVTTGSSRVMAYQIWRESQTSVPSFLWQPISTRPLKFYSDGARQFRDWEVSVAQPMYDSPARVFVELIRRHGISLRELIGPVLLPAFLCWSPNWFSRRPGRRQLLFFVVLMLLLIASIHYPDRRIAIIANLIVLPALVLRWRDKRERLPVFLVLVGAAVTSLSTFYMNNYFAPFVAAVILLMITGLRKLSLWDRAGGGRGSALAGGAFAASLLMLLVQLAAGLAKHPVYGGSDLGRFDYPPFETGAEISRKLDSIPGRHLVLVRTSEQVASSSINEIVWNGADIDRQQTVWARDVNPSWTAAAVRYYPGRDVWLVVRSSDAGWELTLYPVNRLPSPPPLDALPNPDQEADEILVSPSGLKKTALAERK